MHVITVDLNETNKMLYTVVPLLIILSQYTTVHYNSSDTLKLKETSEVTLCPNKKSIAIVKFKKKFEKREFFSN